MFIDRFRYQATKASQVQSRIKMLEKVVPIEVPPERKKIHFNFPACAKSGRTVLELKHVAQGLRRPRRLRRPRTCTSSAAIASRSSGPNGVGKSTLMRMLSGEEAPDSGERASRPQRRDAVFRAGRGDADGSGADRLRDAVVRIADCRWCRRSATSSAASSSRATTSTSSVRVLSGGERTRLAVARMLLRPSNTLLLDEPTNHLDLDSKEVLLDALVDYGGTLIFVSHDRYFVERLATKIIEIGSGTRDRVSRHLQGVPVSQGSTQGRTGRIGRQRGGSGTAGKGRPAASDWQHEGGHGPGRARAKAAPRQSCHRPDRPSPQPDNSAVSRREEARRRRDAQDAAQAAGARRRAIDDARGADRRDRSAPSARSSSRCPRPGSTKTAPAPSR
mgnify:CR=1 FL=1